MLHCPGRWNFTNSAMFSFTNGVCFRTQTHYLLNMQFISLIVMIKVVLVNFTLLDHWLFKRADLSCVNHELSLLKWHRRVIMRIFQSSVYQENLRSVKGKISLCKSKIVVYSKLCHATVQSGTSRQACHTGIPGTKVKHENAKQCQDTDISQHSILTHSKWRLSFNPGILTDKSLWTETWKPCQPKADTHLWNSTKIADWIVSNLQPVSFPL